MSKQLNREQITQLAGGKSPSYIKGVEKRDSEEIIVELAQRLKRFHDRGLREVVDQMEIKSNA